MGTCSIRASPPHDNAPSCYNTANRIRWVAFFGLAWHSSVGRFQKPGCRTQAHRVCFQLVCGCREWLRPVTAGLFGPIVCRQNALYLNNHSVTGMRGAFPGCHCEAGSDEATQCPSDRFISHALRLLRCARKAISGEDSPAGK